VGLFFAGTGLAGTPKVKGKTYVCSHCKETFNKSEVWIELKDPSMDWQGTIPLSCMACWNAESGPQYQWTDVQWRRECKKQWQARANSAAEHVQKRARVLNWQAAVADIGDRYPGESQKEFRKRIAGRSMKFAASIAKSIHKMRPEQQKVIGDQFDTWIKEWEHKARDETTCRSSRTPPCWKTTLDSSSRRLCRE